MNYWYRQSMAESPNNYTEWKTDRKSINCMIPFIQNSGKCKTHLQWQSIDSWLPRMGGAGGEITKRLRNFWGWGIRSLSWCDDGFMRVCAQPCLTSWRWLHEAWQRSNCTEAADRLSKMRTGNWPFNSGLWWSSVILMSSSGGVRGWTRAWSNAFMRE